MRSDPTIWYVLGSIVGFVVFFLVLYLVIRYAVLHALRDHTMGSTTAVSVVSAVPLKLAKPDDPVAGPSDASEQREYLDR